MLLIAFGLLSCETVQQQQEREAKRIKARVADSLALVNRMAVVAEFVKTAPIDSVQIDPTVFAIDQTDKKLVMLSALLRTTSNDREIDVLHQIPQGSKLELTAASINTIIEAKAMELNRAYNALVGEEVVYQTPNSHLLFEYNANDAEQTNLVRVLDKNMSLKSKVWLAQIGGNNMLTGSAADKQAVRTLLLLNELQEKMNALANAVNQKK